MSETPARMLVAHIGKEQRIGYRITPSPNSLLPADSLGGQLTALAQLFAELGKQDGQPLKTLVHSICMEEDGSVKFDLVIVPLASPPEPPQ